MLTHPRMATCGEDTMAVGHVCARGQLRVMIPDTSLFHYTSGKQGRRDFLMRSQAGFVAKLFLCVGLLFSLSSFASDWQLIGPEGGNVRSLAYDPGDPNRILLGTSAGQLFISQDGGKSWAIYAHIGLGDDYVLDHIVFDPSNPATVYVSAWGLFNDNEGGVF